MSEQISAVESERYPSGSGGVLVEMLQTLQAVKEGDFSVRMRGDWDGLAGKIADTVNDIIITNQRMANQLQHLGHAVGREGLTNQRVRLGLALGAWGEMEQSINGLVDDLLQPTTEVTRTIEAVAQGNLLQPMRLDVDGRPLKGEFLRSATIVNTMIKQLSIFTSEVTRVAREVGIEGKLGGQAQIGEVTGVWKDLTESVNLMASNLTAQVRNIAEVTIAVANGDLSKKITVDVRGEILQLKEAINTMVEQLRSFAAEVTRVAREVGTEGRLGGQAVVPGVGGTWKDLTDNVNLLAANLTTQVRNIAEVTTAVARGDLSRKITVDVKGEILELKNTINTMVDQLNAFASEVTRVAREVGTEGRLGGQAAVPGVAGTWKDLTDNVNSMAGNLTGQVRNIAEVATAIARGDLSKKVTVNVSGEILQLKETINTMVDQLNGFAGEVTRVAREVGTEGKLGGQAQVSGVAGTWKDLTDSVNSMASNLTTQVRNIAEVSGAIARGDLSKKIDVDVKGEILDLKTTINTMVDQLNAFASEVTRVAREVGTEGKLGGQAAVPGVAGTWKDLTDNVNSMAGNLTGQVRNIAEVTTAVARGDLSRKITVDVKGEILELKNTINTMVDQLNAFASEVTRVAREVGTEGKLGGQAQVSGVAGTWKDLTDNVNFMAGNLTAQVRNIAEVATAIASGDLSKKITVDVRGEILLLKETLNTMVEQLRSFAAEVTRVAREVGTEGRLGGQAVVPGVGGTWKDLTDNVNLLAANLTTQVRNIAEVTTAVARGDLSRKITVDVKGEILDLKTTINTMVDQLNAFASEVTRVAREVGTEGRLGGQATVPGVAGTWKDLTDTVNVMAANLTEQVRGIVKVVTAVANGDLKPKLTVKSKGEVAALAETINDMTETLALFADQVTTVAREVGVEGRLGGQANVPGTAGTWKDLTGNVNLLAANLTTQVRAIAEVTTAVARGDLSRTIQVEARGEVAELKDYINTMIGNLRLTTQLNTEQDWLKTNLARFTSMLQGQRDVMTVSQKLLSELVPLINAHQGVIYQYDATNSELKLLASYADDTQAPYPERLGLGSSLVGQCAVEKQRRVLTDIPQPTTNIDSVVFKAPPRSVIVHPITFEDRLKAVISLSSLQNFEPAQLTFLEQLSVSIGVVLNSIEATMQTESLLMQSQQLAGELQDQQRAMQKTNEELAQKAQQLAERNVEVERKNEEIDQARRAVEEKAAELALTSRYKSEFLANMSHELRTPLNSILILGQQLSDNPDKNLTEKQVEFARTIHGAGTDLLNLISDILDLSKIESGTVSVDAEEVAFGGLIEAVARPFRHEAERRGLDFQVTFDADLGKTIFTDSKRLQQVLKNLLSNAFKFTRDGFVRLAVKPANGNKWNSDHPILSTAPTIVAFEVQDSGIGIPSDKQKLIFEAFQQADASTSRKYGGTGLGLAISRELAHLLGGEIQLTSEPGVGSVFTLYVPLRYASLASEVRTKSESNMTSPVALPHPGLLPSTIEDDRDNIVAGDQVLLIVEDDPNFARILLDSAHDTGFKGIVCQRGVDAMTLATDYNPTAISLDIHLPDILGWSVLSQLKHNPLTRHIPVQVLTLDDDRHHGLARGAYSFLTKPLQADQLKSALRKIGAFSATATKRLLIVEDDPAERLSISTLLKESDVEILTAEDGKTAIDTLRLENVDCVVLDLKLPDMSGFEILEHMSRQETMRDIPVIVFTGRELSSDENLQIRQYARTVVVKGVESPERLLDETALFLHRVVTELPAEKRELLSRLHDTDDYLVGRKVLLVDDDARNIFALSSLLERRGMEVLTATTGLEAIETLSTTDVSIVLMDIMMPEMDGYQTMQKIRSSEKNQRLPIIALTAKAMKGDREKCLEAGASDYLAKPVDTEQLFVGVENVAASLTRTLMPAENAPIEPVNILLVDDQPGKLLTYEAILDGLDATLIKATTAEEALTALLKTDIAVILMDVCMPDLDGFELAAMIRDHPRHEKTAVIFISAVRLETDDLLKGYRTGAVDYVSVPVVPEILKAKVQIFVELYRKTRQLDALNAELEERVKQRAEQLEASHAALQESSERLRLASEAAKLATFEYDATTQMLRWSANTSDVLHRDVPEQQSFEDFMSVVHDDDREMVRNYVRTANYADSIAELEYRVTSARGISWILARGRAINIGETQRVLGTVLDITERKSAESHQQLLMAELDHRVKNILANVAAIARLSSANAVSVASFASALDGRIHAMSSAHDLLRQSSWTGVDLHELVQGALAPFRSRSTNDIIVDGDRIRLTSKFGQSMALVLHELVTNAVKHGALSTAGGKVNVGWSRITTPEGDKIAFSWQERGGPHCSKPARNGFGLAVIRSAASECGGTAEMTFSPEGFQFDFQGELSSRTQLVGTRHIAIVPKARTPLPAANIPAPRSCRILLVEDEALIAMQLKLDLETEGHTVVGPYAQLSEGLRAATETNFDIALLDINLGADNSAPIAEILDRRMIPFAFTTGYNDLVFLPPRLREYPHLKKPYNPGDVTDLIKMLAFRADEQHAASTSNQVA